MSAATVTRTVTRRWGGVLHASSLLPRARGTISTMTLYTDALLFRTPAHGLWRRTFRAQPRLPNNKVSYSHRLPLLQVACRQRSDSTDPDKLSVATFQADVQENAETKPVMGPIEKVEKEIQDVKNEIIDVEKQMKTASSEELMKWFREEKMMLRKELEQLREKENKLLDANSSSASHPEIQAIRILGWAKEVDKELQTILQEENKVDKELQTKLQKQDKFDKELQKKLQEENAEQFLAAFCDEIVNKDQGLKDTHYLDWKYSEESSSWATQLLKLYNIATSDKEKRRGETVMDDEVVDIGENVLSLGMTTGIDRDSKESCRQAIFLRQEQLKVAKLAVEAALFPNATFNPKVAVPGSPGAGKTFGTMAATVAEILQRRYPVYRITGKGDTSLHFFLPSSDGQIIQAWEATFPDDGLWNRSIFASMKSVVTVIDPPEEKDQVRQQSLTGRSIKIPSDNSSKHYLNLAKSGSVIYTNPPTNAEALVICRCIVTNDKGGAISTFKGKKDLQIDSEIRRRIDLVGPYPRYVINYKAFKDRVEEIIQAVQSLGHKMNNVTLSRLNINKTLQVESGKLQSTFAKGETADTRGTRSFKLHPLTMYAIAAIYRDRIEGFVDTKSSAELAAFFERDVCKGLLSEGFSSQGRELSFPEWSEPAKESSTKSFNYLEPAGQVWIQKYPAAELVFSGEDNQASGYKAILELKTDGGEVLVLPTPNFPVADFALGQNWFVNAKSGKESSTFKCFTVLNFLAKLGLVEMNGKEWQTCAGKEDKKVKLDLVGLGNLEKKCVLKGTQAEYELVKKHLQVTNIDTSTKDAGNEFFKLIERSLENYELQMPKKRASLENTADQADLNSEPN